MIDLCISGNLNKDLVVFSLNGESQTVDQFSKQVHFSIEERKTYRLYFEQRSEQYIPHYAEVLLNILFLPIRGIFNVLTFNTIQDWAKDISAFKLSGYIDINLRENTEISFMLTQGNIEKTTHKFRTPSISFSPNVSVEQQLTPDIREITKKHNNHLLNICSASILLFALLFYLLAIGLKNKNHFACVATSLIIIMFIVLTVYLILNSFKKRKTLMKTFINQCGEKIE